MHIFPYPLSKTIPTSCHSSSARSFPDISSTNDQVGFGGFAFAVWLITNVAIPLYSSS